MRAGEKVRAIARLLRDFRRDDSGQALMFGAISFFAIMIVALMILGVGQVASTQVNLQTAADAAAYSGAELLADSLAQIAWFNEAMAAIYARMMRYAVDVSSLGVMTELEAHQGVCFVSDGGTRLRPLSGEELSSVGLPSLAPSESTLSPSMSNFSGKHFDALERARENLERAEKWLARLSRIQRHIAYITPTLVDHQISFVAYANGALRHSWHQQFRMLGSAADKWYVHLEHFNSGDIVGQTGYERSYSTSGWHMWRDNYYDVYARHTVMSATSGGADQWELTMRVRDDPEQRILIDTTYGNPPDTYPMIFNMRRYVGTEETEIISGSARYDEDGNLVIGSLRNGVETDITIRPRPDGNPDIAISNPGIGTVVFHYDDEGYLCRWEDSNSDGEIQDDEWVRLGEGVTQMYWHPSNDTDGDNVPDSGEYRPLEPGEEPPEGSVVVPINYDYDRDLDLGDGVTARIGMPFLISVEGLEIIFGQDSFSFNFHLPGGGWAHVEDDGGSAYWASINGLRTDTTEDDAEDPSDDHWHRVNWNDYANHRMVRNVGADPPTSPTDQWRYEWLSYGAFLTNENMHRFGLHAICGYDPWYRRYGGSVEPEDYLLPADPDLDAPNPGDENLWDQLPGWCRPRDDGGWFSMKSGAPYDRTAYYQSRECWYCNSRGASISGDGIGRLRDYRDDGDTAGQLCERPCGFWHETYDADRETELLNAHFEVIQCKEEGSGTIVGLQVTCPCCGGMRYIDPENPVDPRDAPTVVRKYLGHARLRQLDIIGEEGHEQMRQWLYSQGPAMSIEEAAQAEFDFVTENALAGFTGNTPGAGSERDWMSVRAPSDRSPPYEGGGGAERIPIAEPPLVLTDEMFRTCIAVAVWNEARPSKVISTPGSLSDEETEAMKSIADSETGVQADLRDLDWEDVTGGEGADATLFENQRQRLRTEAPRGRLGVFNPLRETDWGHFAVSAAKVMVGRWPDDVIYPLNGPPSGSDPEAVTVAAWPWTDFSGPVSSEMLDPTGRLKNPWREEWLASHANLYEADWRAGLVRFSSAIDMLDYVVLFSSGDPPGTIILNELPEPEDNASTYLFRRMYARWRKSVISSGHGHHSYDAEIAEGWSHMHAPPMQDHEGSINWDNPDVEKVILH